MKDTVKRLLVTLLTLTLLFASSNAFGEDNLHYTFGYLAPYRAEQSRDSLRADALRYAVQRKGMDAVIVRYTPANTHPAGDEVEESLHSDVSYAAATDELADEEPAAIALRGLLDEGVDGIIIVPETLEQAVMLTEMAYAAGVPAVVEGLDISEAYPSTPDPSDIEERPYVASVGYDGGEAAYVASKWLEENCYNPMLFHCALPVSNRNIQTGLRRALSEAEYLALVSEINAYEDSIEAGRDATLGLLASGAMFQCVLADSAELAEGCAQELQNEDDTCIAALTEAEAAPALLGRGIDLIAGEPVSSETMCAFKALLDYLNDGTLPEGKTRRISLSAVTASGSDASHWIADNDFEAAYEQVWPSEEEE